MSGVSSGGYTQFAAEGTDHPSPKAIIPEFEFCDAYSVNYCGGALALGSGESWSLLSGELMAILRQPGTDAEKAWPDVLVYNTPVLDHDVETTGPLKVNLWAATSAPDTDFTVN